MSDALWVYLGYLPCLSGMGHSLKSTVNIKGNLDVCVMW